MVICAIVGCGNRSKRDKEKGFYRLPTIIEHQGAQTKELSSRRQQAWLAKIKREDIRPDQYHNLRVCSDHFVSGAPSTLYDVLNPDWAPSLKMVYENASVSTKSQTDRYERAMKRRKMITEKMTVASEITADVSCLSDVPVCNDSEADFETITTNTGTFADKTTMDVAVQTDLSFSQFFDLPLHHEVEALRTELTQVKKENSNLKETLESKLVTNSAALSEEDLQDNDAKVLFYTGLTTWELLMTVFTFIKPYLKGQSCLSPFQQLVMTLMRLRLNLQGQDLAYRFQVSTSTVSRIFLHVLDVLFVRLKPLIIWPDRDLLKKTMPMVFRKHYPSCVVIIDCFEIFLDRPTNLLARAQTFSAYKHHNTVKYLIGITPQGTVSYISEGWGGRTSDKYITNHSSLLNKLIPGDTVLADRGFDISDSVGMCHARLEIPAFTKNKKQLDGITVEQTRNLANVRIHVERVIGTVRKKYSLLNATQPIEFVNTDDSGKTTLDKIVLVSCALTNICDSVVPFD